MKIEFQENKPHYIYDRASDTLTISNEIKQDKTKIIFQPHRCIKHDKHNRPIVKVFQSYIIFIIEYDTLTEIEIHINPESDLDWKQYLADKMAFEYGQRKDIINESATVDVSDE